MFKHKKQKYTIINKIKIKFDISQESVYKNI